MIKPNSRKGQAGRKPSAPKRVKQQFPPGWDEAKVRQVIEHYDRLTDDARAAEIEAAAEAADHTLMAVPNDLVPAVRALIAQHQQSA